MYESSPEVRGAKSPETPPWPTSPQVQPESPGVCYHKVQRTSSTLQLMGMDDLVAKRRCACLLSPQSNLESVCSSICSNAAELQQHQQLSQHCGCTAALQVSELHYVNPESKSPACCSSCTAAAAPAQQQPQASSDSNAAASLLHRQKKLSAAASITPQQYSFSDCLPPASVHQDQRVTSSVRD